MTEKILTFCDNCKREIESGETILHISDKDFCSEECKKEYFEKEIKR